jgi:two-component system, chemotaxis family, CheB/CheR fusion protein
MAVDPLIVFFKHLATDLGMAYVVVFNFADRYKQSFLKNLQQATAMPIKELKNRCKVEPDTVYIVPRAINVLIDKGYLRVGGKINTTRRPIDNFMDSASIALQHNAIGVLLDGAVVDGSNGLKSVKLAGGVTFIDDGSGDKGQQDLHGVFDVRYVDFVLPPHRIAEELKSLVSHALTAKPADEILLNHTHEIEQILSLVYKKYGVDFFLHYKRNTVVRRVMRRMAISQLDDFAEYYTLLRANLTELDALYNDMLINVTGFFREPSFYALLKKVVLPELLKNQKTNDLLRIWVAGCATGEEAYSIAITIVEFLEHKRSQVPVQIFATDLDETAIAKARVGIYPKGAVEQLSANQINAFFTKIDGHYQIIKSVRDMCVFSVHNLLKDPPFSRIDLISCQNVLIYMETVPQRKVFQLFHYALKASGFLVLGKSESIGSVLDLFKIADNSTNLYRRKSVKAIPLSDLSLSPGKRILNRPLPHLATFANVENAFDDLLLSRYVPTSVLVNKELEILRFRGSTSTVFHPAPGKASLNLLKMLKEELVFEVRRLFQKAKRSKGGVIKDDLDIEGMDTLTRIEIAPLKNQADIYYLVVFHFERANKTQNTFTRSGKAAPEKRMKQMELALKDARAELRMTLEDFEISREELQVANEEIVSSNEELQSINEELETSKEELQSANEELTTINEELQTRVEELKQSYHYIQAILDTMHGPLLVINGKMKVRTANKAFYDFFRLQPEKTEGKLVREFAGGRWDFSLLNDQLRELNPKSLKFKSFEISHDFPFIGERTMMINAHVLTRTDAEAHILLAFQDITEFRNNELKLKEARQQLKLALEGGAVGTWAWDIRTNAVSGSREEAILFGLDEQGFFKEFIEWKKALYPDDVEYVVKALRNSVEQKKPMDIEFRIVHPDGHVRWLLSKANVHYDDAGHPVRMLGINIDITERKQAVEALEESEKRFHTLSDQAPVMIWMTDENQHTNFVNKTWLSFTGKSMTRETGMGWYDGIHPDDQDQFLSLYTDAFQKRLEFKADYRLKRHNGEYRWILAHGVPRYTHTETFLGYIGTSIDITDRIELERQKDDFMGIASHELKTPVTSIKAYAQILYEKFKKLNDDTSASMLARLDKQIDKLTSLINTLLDVARIQSGQMEYDADYFDSRLFTQEIVEEMQRTTVKHHIVIEANEPAGTTAYADRARVGQVLSNLISNAIKYSPDEKIIIVRTALQDNNILFSVRDFGVGIQRNLHERIFERFYRVSEQAGNRVSGLGLGLFISAQIIRQQGGKIWVESEPAEGSEFLFSLPLQK